MHLNDEITATEEMIALARANAVEVLASTAPRLNLDAKTLAHYQKFIDWCLASAASILAECRTIAAMPDVPPDVAKQVIEPLLLRAYEPTHSMYLGMMVIECVATAPRSDSTDAKESVVRAARATPEALVPPTGSIVPNKSAPANDPERICSFCGKTQSETDIVAAPVGGICAPCTRLVATIHGIGLAE
jgi:hypothetical protein